MDVEMVVVVDDAVVEVVACLQEAEETSSSLQGDQIVVVDVDQDEGVVGDSD